MRRVGRELSGVRGVALVPCGHPEHHFSLPPPLPPHPSATSEGQAWAAANERFEAACDRLEAAEDETDSWWDVRSNNSESSDELGSMGRSLADNSKERE